MKFVLSIICLIICLHFTQSENPGLVGGLTLPIISKIKQQYFTTFMEEFRNIDVEEIKSGSLQISGIEVDAENGDHNNVQVAFNEEKNGININVDGTKINVECHWRIDGKVLGKKVKLASGKATVSSTIKHVSMMIGFETQENEGFLIPKINIQDFVIDIDKGQFKPSIKCDVCEKHIIEAMVNLFKSDLVKKIESTAKGVVNHKIADEVNYVLASQYPLSVALNEHMSVSLANTGVINIKNDYLSVPLDSTVFLTTEGYNRPVEAPAIPEQEAENPGEIQLYASTYLYETFEKAINKIPLDLQTSIMGFDASFKVDGTQDPIEIATREGQLHAHVGGILEVPALRIIAEVGFTSDLDINFGKGDSTNMLYIDPDIKTDSLQITKIKLSVWGFALDLTPFTSIVNKFISFTVNWFILPKIPIGKIEALPLTSTGTQIDFHESYTSAGIQFNFGMDY